MKLPGGFLILSIRNQQSPLKKAVELLDKFNGEFIENGTVHAIRHSFLPFLGDRELNVYLDWLTIGHCTNRVIVIEFDDDDGRRQIMRLS